MKHATLRFAWHDSKWNGTVCKNPERNIYCTGSYSLLSPRIQRRIDLLKEQKYRGRKVTDIQKEAYIPPCYWCLNALGDSECIVEDQHPFADTGGRFSSEFAMVPPLKYKLNEFCVFSWNFKLGYAEKGSYERYVPPEELNHRVKQYLDELVKGKSIVFFYANYSNPITADYYKYLLLGAGVVKDVKEPKEYDIPKDLVERIRSQRGMANMPTTAWQFQILLDPDTVFVLPYHEYLDLIDKEKDESASIELWKKLDEVAIRIEETTLIPNFKYVSMHLEHDKAIYLLYLIRQSVRQMKNHNLINYSLINEIEQKVDELLELAWEQRGKYPGFRNALLVILSHDLDKEYLKETIIPRVEKYINENCGSIEKFFESLEKVEHSAPSDIAKSLRILKKNKDRLEFLSLFDFTITQFENVERLINIFGFGTIKANPYVILENYQFDFKDSWDINECDYGISIYQIDMALIPDPKYADWETTPYDARSPERLRALITKILYDSANQEGNSCLTREEILNRIQNYPLYYINEKLKIDQNLLLQYEKQPIFKDKFLMVEDPQRNEVIYQLKKIREIEGIIEEFIGKMLKKTYSVDTKIIEGLVSKELELFKDKIQFLDINERRSLYTNALKQGVFVISGKAGSGKTHAVINLITKFVETKKLPIFVFTPTGKANLVIRNRLKKLNLHKVSNIRVSTIHRFLYRALSDYFMGFTARRAEIIKLEHMVEDLLEGKLEILDEFRKLVKGWSFNPRVVIVDETSMVDEILLAVLFSMINPETFEHLIFVGDERQLPPIGVGRPFVDLIFYLKQKGLETNFIHLKSNLRFDPSTSLGMFSDLFSGKEAPSPMEIEYALNRTDESLEKHHFSNAIELRSIIKKILAQVGCNLSNSIFDMFTEAFESEGKLNLDKVQIITPRRIGDYGSIGINRNVVLEGAVQYAPNTKLICEENIYFNAKGSRVLGLANGSIGYIQSDGDIYFEDIDELIEDYGYENVQRLKHEVSLEVYSPLRTERKIDLGYAITVHKSQGSDFDHVILVFSQVSPFITRELLYTAFTRPRTKLHLIVHDDLKDKLSLVLMRAYDNSLVEQRKTLLFGHKTSPFKPYKLTLKDKTILEVDSKIEWIIAKLLDEMNIKFDYGIEEFLASYHVKPDFKIYVNGKVYYIEHLGRMDNVAYRERWLKKFEIYKNQLGIADILITTSESEEATDIEENIRKMINDVLSGNLQKTEGFSYHHYEI